MNTLDLAPVAVAAFFLSVAIIVKALLNKRRLPLHELGEDAEPFKVRDGEEVGIRFQYSLLKWSIILISVGISLFIHKQL